MVGKRRILKSTIVYPWMLDPPYGNMYCFMFHNTYYFNSHLWQPKETSMLYDEELEMATRKINAILENIEKRNRNSGRKLSFTEVNGQLCLIWSNHRTINP